MGVSVIVDNRPGAGGVIGGAECAKSIPDGYTLCLMTGEDSPSFAPYTVPNLPYDPARDFRPISNLYKVVEGLIARQTLPANSMADLRRIEPTRQVAYLWNIRCCQ